MIQNNICHSPQLLKNQGYEFDIAFTSDLKRAIKTLYLIQEEMDNHWMPVVRNWRLNERHYGALQGLNKSETAAKYGEDQVKVSMDASVLWWLTFNNPDIEIILISVRGYTDVQVTL